MQKKDIVLDDILVLKEMENEYRLFLENSYNEYEKKGYKKIVEESQKEKNKFPFLSIVVRTQGRREESLREVFLCLEGQENQNYEVLLIGHKLSEEQYKVVQKVVDQQSEQMKEKVRYIPLDYGNRTVPLNVGFGMAWGEYVVTLDDDDIVMDNWVSNFYSAAQENKGKVLYNYALTQDWSVLNEGKYQGGLRAESAFGTEFASDFDEVTQVELNRCPPVGLAYPSKAFQKMGIIFDEELATTEDWDYLMRVAYVCGVKSIGEPACIYRKWINAENSFTVHKQEEWDRNYKTIIKKINNKPLYLPEGSAAKIVDLIRKSMNSKGGAEDNGILEEYVIHDENGAKTCILDFERVYAKCYENYSEDLVIRATNIDVKADGQFELVYDVQGKLREANQFRWDPIEKGVLAIKNLLIVVEGVNGEKLAITQDQVKHTGVNVDEYIILAQDDPQIYFNTVKGIQISGFVIEGNVKEGLPIEVINKLTEKKKFWVQLKEKIVG